MSLKIFLGFAQLVAGVGFRHVTTRFFPRSNVTSDFMVDVPHEVVEEDEPDLLIDDEKVISEANGECRICSESYTPRTGEVIQCCVHCNNCWCHAQCFNRAVFAMREIDGEDPWGQVIVNIEPPSHRCPCCRGEISERVDPVFRYTNPIVPNDNPIKNFLVGGIFECKRDWDGKALTFLNAPLPVGCEFVINPWIIFRDRVPRQYIKRNGIFWCRFTVKIDGLNYTYKFRVMGENDFVCATYGPICIVFPREGNQWPLKWSSAGYVRYAGSVVVRNYHGRVNFNEEGTVSRMVEIITRDIPAWECIEHDCLSWIRSPEATELIRDQRLKQVYEKDATQRLMWLTKALESDLCSTEIWWLYTYHQYIGAFKQLLYLLLCFLPLFFYALYEHLDWVRLSGLLCYAWLLYRMNRVVLLFNGVELPKLRIANTLSIWKTCSFGIKTPKIAPEANLKIPSGNCVRCEERRSIEVYGCVISGSPVVIPMGCKHDIENGLKIRFLFDRPWYDGILDKSFLSFSKSFLGRVQWSFWYPFSKEDWLRHLPAKRRNRLQSESDVGAFTSRSWGSDIFVKGEAYVGKTWKSFKPRIIQCRKSALQLLIGPFFYSLYKCLVRTFSRGPDIFATSKNALELGKIVEQMSGEGMLFEGDAANWDGSVTNTMLRIEKFFLQNILPYKPIYLEQLLERWLVVKGSAKGVAFSCDWGRRSGDMWTSAFNTLLNILITNFVWGKAYIGGVYNGDDNFFVVQKGCGVSHIVERYASLGLKMELVPRSGWQTLEFCSGRFYRTWRGIKWGLKPFRQLSKFGINFKRHSKKQFKSLLLGSALSMLPIAGHVPIFGLFLRSIVRTSGRITPTGVGREEWQITDVVIDDIHPDEEERFRVMYGLSDLEYRKLQNWALNVDINDFPMVLDDPIFSKCAIVDGGSVNPALDHYASRDWIEVDHVPFIPPFIFDLWTVFESFVHWYFAAPYWMVLAIMETFCGSYFAIPVHILLAGLTRYLGLTYGAIVHLLYNRYIGTANLLKLSLSLGTYCYDACHSKMLKGHKATVYVRMPRVFTPILDCVGILNNRLTRYIMSIFDKGNSEIGYINIPARTKNNSKKRTTRKLVVVSKPRVSVVRKTKRRNIKRKPRTEASKFALITANPFISDAEGARIPDGYAYPSATLCLRAAFELGTNPTYVTGAAIAFYPHIVNYAAQPASISAGGTITWLPGPSGFNLPQSVAFEAAFSSFRVVGGGLRITTEQSIATASGHLWVAHVAEDIDADSLGMSYFPNVEAGFAAMPLSEKYPTVELATNPLIVPFRRLDNSSYRYRDNGWPQTASPYAETNTGWCAIVLYAAGLGGGASANIFNIEYVLHVEALHKGSNGTLITPATGVCPNNERELSRVANMSVALPIAHVESREEASDPLAWFDKFDGVVNRAARTIGTAVGGGVSLYNAYKRATGGGNGGQGRSQNYIEYL